MSGESMPSARGVVPGWTGLDSLLLVLVTGAWLVLVRFTQGSTPTLPYDAFRDLASVHNILAGRFGDPSIRGAEWWYAPGYPLLMAVACRMTGAGVLAVCGSAASWFNVLIPAGLYVLARLSTSRTAALLALPMVGLGSMWWLTHYRAAMPSVSGVAFVLFSLAAWTLAIERGRAWPLVTGLLVAATAWVHPLCAVILCMAIALHAGALVLANAPRKAGEGVSARARASRAGGIAFATAAVLAGPLALHLAALPRLNPAPFGWFAPELHDPQYALQSHAPLVPLLGLVGAALLWRRAPGRAVAVAWMVAGLLGAGAGYARHDLGLAVPSLLPHEFQWQAQMAMGVCASAGAVGLAGGFTRGDWPRRAVLAVLVIAAVAPALRYLGREGVGAMKIDGGWAPLLKATDWMRGHTALDDCLIAPPEPSLFLSGLTGRKVVALPPAHMNISVDPGPRLADLRRMLGDSQESTFVATASRYEPCWLVVVPGPGQGARMREALGAWRSLVASGRPDSSVLVYRVDAARAVTIRAAERP